VKNELEMRLYVDGRWFSQPGQGVATYLLGLHEQLLAAHDQRRHRDIELVFGVQSNADLPGALKGRAETIELGNSSFAWRLFSLPDVLRRHGIDIAHFQYSAPLAKKGIRHIVTIHDALFMSIPEHFSLRYRVPRWALFGLAAHRADAVITVSEQSAEDIARHFHLSRPIDIVYNGTETSLRNEAPEPVDDLQPSQFLLSVGRVEPRKNYRRLAEAFRNSRAQAAGFKLVIVGFCSDEFRAEGAALIENSDVMWLNGARDGQLNWLFQNARAFLFPSIGEGFGIPVLEALNAGLPCAISDSYPLTDVKDICIRFNPLDTTEMRRAIDVAINALPPTPLSIAHLTSRYAWPQMADRYADILRRVLAQPIR
jgi:glycosyltransferase involved in cell wall biosynthesis